MESVSRNVCGYCMWERRLIIVSEKLLGGRRTGRLLNGGALAAYNLPLLLRRLWLPRYWIFPLTLLFLPDDKCTYSNQFNITFRNVITHLDFTWWVKWKKCVLKLRETPPIWNPWAKSTSHATSSSCSQRQKESVRVASSISSHLGRSGAFPAGRRSAQNSNPWLFPGLLPHGSPSTSSNYTNLLMFSLLSSSCASREIYRIALLFLFQGRWLSLLSAK